MPKRKTQKVKFHKGDQRPGGLTGTLSYAKKMIYSIREEVV